MATQVALFPLDSDEDAALDDAVEHGEVFTRRWVVDLILNLAGYTADKDLADFRAVEPACGGGAFLGPMVERLSESLRRQGRSLSDASDSLRAYDLRERNVQKSRLLVASTLSSGAWDVDEAARFADKIVTRADYLLQDREDCSVDFVLGNPPYIRLEDLPAARSNAYRAACPTMGGRADTYVGFIEVGLRSLRAGGVLGYIVADRWMHNAYGDRLRRFVASGYSVDATIQMHDVDAFDEQVSAYPAVSILRRDNQGPSVVAHATRSFGPSDAQQVASWYGAPVRASLQTKSVQLDELPHWFAGDALWPSGGPATIRLMEELSDRFQPLEDPRTKTKVGIGIATGADGVYVTRDADAAEPERMLPLSMAQDTNSGVLTWSGNYLVNPWDDDGLVELSDWPALSRYMTTHGESLRRRSVAKRNPHSWHRTIDRVTPGLAERPKLLFPDMRMTSRPVFDPGGLYPHHNLYYVVSDVWDLRVLGGLLFSRIAEATIEAYCVKMRGGTLRFQAQYLRMIRLPKPGDISTSDASSLAEAFENRDAEAATEAALRAYQLSGGLSVGHARRLTT